MLRNYFFIAVRNLRNTLVYSALNVIGLSIGIASCLVVGLFVMDQYSYDSHHANAEQIYRVVNKQTDKDKVSYVAITQGVLGKELPKVFPEIKQATRVGFTRAGLKAKEGDLFHESLMAVDNEFFDIFTIPFLIKPTTGGINESGIMISESAAKRLFADKNPIGKTIAIPGFVDLNVTAVFHDFPYQSHLYTDFIISFIWIEKTEPVASSWSSNSYYNYLLMSDAVDIEAFNKKMNAFIGKHTPSSWKSFEYFLQPLQDINLQPGYAANPKGSIGKIIIMGFSMVGVIILVLATLNYMNLSTARSAKRSIEVGVRKVMGAYRSQIVAQFMIESFILCILSFLLAILWADLTVPLFNAFTGLHISMSTLLTTKALISLGSFIVVLTVLAGSYPAFFLSRFLPIATLKGEKSNDTSRVVRKGLVVFQFTITTALVILVLVVWKQTNFMRTQDLGFNKNALLLLSAELKPTISTESFKNELYKIPGVKKVAVATDRPGARMNSTTLWAATATEEESIKILWTFADHDYIPALELNLIAGENFKNDSTAEEGVIINELAASALGWKPEQAIGKRVVGFTFKKENPGFVIGVIKNFHISPLRKEMMPLVIGYQSSNPLHLIRLEDDNLFRTKELIDATALQFAQGEKPASVFMEDALENSYMAEIKTGQMLSFFTILAIVLGCSGLYALSNYEGERRLKELGIRKIMGASSPQLLALLSANFLKPIVIALFIGMPLAYYLGNIWLRVYPYRIDWTADIFFYSGLSILMLGWVTILIQAIKATRLNPVETLRYE